MPRFPAAISPAHALALMAVFLLTPSAQAGPLPSNVTITEGISSESSSCALGDVVYMSGDEFPGTEACERCACRGGRVACARQECAPRPGCKAVHRPDHCCPTYQCECEQEGRVYGNGEKLVDPQDPCRVCYCQGGEVVCRRIACFVRDDCRPRLVPGRCCPEYDNCPLRGVSTSASMSPSNMAIEDVGPSSAPPPPPPVRQEITIKEITPVSEIPVITDVKIKEILPSPSIEVVEYPSSKAPLIPREATSDKPVSGEEEQTSTAVPPAPTPELTKPPTGESVEIKTMDEMYPSKISFSTQDAINSDIYPSNIPSVSAPSFSAAHPASSTKAPVIEEEDTSVFEHNPAFPPLPDDLSVLSNHEDEMVAETMDDHSEHAAVTHEIVTTGKSVTEAPSTAVPPVTETSPSGPTTTPTPDTTTEPPTSRTEPDSVPADETTKTEMLPTKVSPMLNIRSAIPTDILSVPSSVREDITGELDEDEPSITTKTPVTSDSATVSITTSVQTSDATTVTSTTTAKTSDTPTGSGATTTTKASVTTTTTTPPPFTQTTKSPLVDQTASSSPETSNEVTQLKAMTSAATSGYTPKADATEVTSLTELSSLPVETSDQHPPAPAEGDHPSTAPPLAAPTSIKMAAAAAEAITVARAGQPSPYDNVETTEFVLSMDSAESTTDPVELIRITSDSDKSAAFIDSGGKKGNVLTDLINLVDDVASMGDAEESPPVSEELIPVNAGYKTKHNFNINSITESPLKSKGTPKHTELDSEDESHIVDGGGGGQREPTTHRAIIDRVDETAPAATAPAADIEIITRSYVPTLGRRPTKVVQAGPAASEEGATDDPAPAPAPAPANTTSTDSIS